MKKFYATATTKEGNSQLINFESMGENAPKHLYQAEQAAQLFCKQNGLIYQGTHTAKGTLKQPSTLTKFKEHRSRHGNNGKLYAKSL